MLEIKEAKEKIIYKVSPSDEQETKEWAEDFISTNEYISMGFSSMMSNIIFTNKRIIIVTSNGIKSKKKDFTSIPYKSISYYSIDTEGLLSSSTGLEIYVNNLGLIRIQFNKEVDIKEIGKMIIESLN